MNKTPARETNTIYLLNQNAFPKKILPYQVTKFLFPSLLL